MNDKHEFELSHSELNKNYKLLQDELDLKSRQLINYTIQLTAVSEKENHYVQEINELQVKEKEDMNKLQDKIRVLQGECDFVRQEYDSKLSSIDNERTKFESEIENYSEAVTISNNDNSISADIKENLNDLKMEIECLNEKLYEREIFLAYLRNDNDKLNKSYNHAVEEFNHIEAEINSKNETLKEVYQVKDTKLEELLLIRNELKSLETKRDGDIGDNSLFSEVNDRRSKLQEILLNEQQKCSEMKKELSRKQKQTSTLRFYNEDLKSILKNDPIEIEQEYEMLLEIYKNCVSILKMLEQQYEKDVSEKQEYIKNGLPNDILQFLDNIDQRYQKVKENIRKCIGVECRAYKVMVLELKENKMQIQELQIKINDLQKKILELECNNLECNNQERSKCKNAYKSATNVQDSVINSNIGEIAGSNCETVKSIIKNYHNESLALKSDDIQTNASNYKNKKVLFTSDTVDPVKHQLRRGRKVITVQTILIPDVIKK